MYKCMRYFWIFIIFPVLVLFFIISSVSLTNPIFNKIESEAYKSLPSKTCYSVRWSYSCKDISWSNLSSSEKNSLYIYDFFKHTFLIIFVACLFLWALFFWDIFTPRGQKRIGKIVGNNFEWDWWTEFNIGNWKKKKKKKWENLWREDEELQKIAERNIF